MLADARIHAIDSFAMQLITIVCSAAFISFLRQHLKKEGEEEEKTSNACLFVFLTCVDCVDGVFHFTGSWDGDCVKWTRRRLRHLRTD